MQDLTDKERRVLATVSKLGEATVSDLAKETLINRTALYHTLAKLSRAGLLVMLRGDRGSRYRAISLNDFDHWAETKQEYMKRALAQLRVAIQDANTTKSLRADVRYFEGRDAVKELYADTWRDNPERKILAITDYTSAYESMERFFLQEYFQDRIQHGVYVQSLLPRSREGVRDMRTQREMLREMRFINLFKDLGIEINIYAQKVAIVAFDKEQPNGVILQNALVNQAFRNIFMYLWKRGTMK